MPRTAEIIAVGSELLTGGVTNTNARFLSELLTAAGVDVLYHTAVGDDENRLEAAVTADPEKAKKYAKLLYDQALLIAGLPLDDPSGYTDLVCGLMK